MHSKPYDVAEVSDVGKRDDEEEKDVKRNWWREESGKCRREKECLKKKKVVRQVCCVDGCEQPQRWEEGRKPVPGGSCLVVPYILLLRYQHLQMTPYECKMSSRQGAGIRRVCGGADGGLLDRSVAARLLHAMSSLSFCCVCCFPSSALAACLLACRWLLLMYVARARKKEARSGPVGMSLFPAPDGNGGVETKERSWAWIRRGLMV